MLRLHSMVRFYFGWHRIIVGRAAKEIGVSEYCLRCFIYGTEKVTDKTLLKIIDWCIQQQPKEEENFYIDSIKIERGKRDNNLHK